MEEIKINCGLFDGPDSLVSDDNIHHSIQSFSRIALYGHHGEKKA
jgi:hypothetical protein